MNKTVIFGAGQVGQMLKNLLNKDYFEVVAFADNNVDIQNTYLDGIKIINPNEITKLDPDIVYLSTLNINSYNEIKNQLKCLRIKSKIYDIFYLKNTIYIRVATLKLISKEIIDNGIKGSVAELGVYQGDFAKEINLLFPDRKLYLFDTFEGFYKEDIDIDKDNNFSKSKIGQFDNTAIELVYNKLITPKKAIFKNGHFP